MEELAKQVIQKIRILPETDGRTKYERFIRTFFNCKSKDNHLLMLGVDDKTLIKEMLGCSAEAIIKEEADYFIRVIKGRDDCMTVSFRKLIKPLTFEEQEQIKSLFKFYGNENNVDLDISFANNRIPDLVIKKGFPTCLESPHAVIRILSGKQLISEVIITTSLNNSNSLHASINDLSIITNNNKLLVDNKVEADQESNFWNLAKEEYGDICQFNFVTLNNVDDHLMRVFTDLFKIYQSEFNISEESRNILKRIFFISDSKYYVSRFANYLPSNLYKDINELVDEHKTISLYVFVLEYMQFNKTKSDYSISDITSVYKDYIDQLESLFKNELSVMLDIIKCFPEKYDTLDKAYKHCIALIQNKKLEERDLYFKAIEAFTQKAIPFAEEYSPKSLQHIVSLKDNIEKEKSIYLKEEKILLLTSYSINKKEFKAYLTKTEKELEKIWTHITTSLNIAACELGLDTLSKKLAQAQTFITNAMEDNYTPVQAHISLLSLKKSIFDSTIKTRIISLTDLCISKCCITSLLDNSTANHLQQLTEEITSDFETALKIETKGIKDFLLQHDIQVDIQSLLFKELRNLQLA